MKKRFSVVLLLVMALLLLTPVTTVVYAATDLDSIESSDSVEFADEKKEKDESFNDKSADSIADYMRGYNAIEDKDMKKAAGVTSTITDYIGFAIGIILILTISFISLVTALDLLYIGVPFMRNLLYPGGEQQQGGSPMMGGMGGYGRAGMMGGGMMGAQQQQQGATRKLVSDEALAAIAQAGATQQQGGSPMMGGMGGMGGYGMMGAQQQQPPKTKSVISIYLKKRIFFLILFAVASVVLFSSIFTECGLNIAKLFMKVMGMVNGQISDIDVG